MWLLVQALTHQKCQFVGVLARGGHSDGPLLQTRRVDSQPSTTLAEETLHFERSAYLIVKVHVAQFVREPLHVVGLQPHGVIHHVVMSRRDTSVDGRLAHDVEVVPGGGRSRQLTTTAAGISSGSEIRKYHDAYHSGRVTPVSTTVPGGGLDTRLPIGWKNLAAMRFVTTTTLSIGLSRKSRK